jgi:hypothetical protein
MNFISSGSQLDLGLQPRYEISPLFSEPHMELSPEMRRLQIPLPGYGDVKPGKKKG